MNALRRLRALVDVLVAPPDAWRSLRAHPALGAPFLALATVAAVLVVVQAVLLEPALRRDPLFADLPAAAPPLLWMRLALALVAPCALLLRALAFGSVVHALTLAAGGSGRWQHGVSLVLHLETIYLLEVACTVLLLGVDRPTSWEEARVAHLRAGLDLFWQPGAPALAGACSAANAFTVWWGVLLAQGMSRLGALPRRRAALLAVPLWITTVTLRFLLHPR